MLRTSHRLNNRLIADNIKKGKGIYADGHGLYLRVIPPNGRSWVFIWQNAQGKRQEAGLGPLAWIDLPQARKRAEQARADVASGLDPRVRRRPKPAKIIPTFGQVADDWITSRERSVTSEKSVARYHRCIGAKGYAAAIRTMPVNEIGTEQVLKVLEPIWHEKQTSAVLTRGYIEAVLAKAKVEGHRSGDNPAAWEQHLEVLLPAPEREAKRNHAALNFHEMPAFMARLRAQDSVASLSLCFTILTAARTGEVLGAKWSEIDLDRAIWTVPKERMKARREHRVPLSPGALAVLRDAGTKEGLVFLGRELGMPLSNMAMEMVLRRMKEPVTVHGFRSTFRDWAGEMTDAAREVAEAALAHRVGDAAELAYRRGDALEKRRQLMQQWSDYCGEPDATRHALRRA